MKHVQRLVLPVLIALFSGLLLSAVMPHVPSGTWAPAASMDAPRTGATATLLPDGRVIIVGGTDANGEPLATAEFLNADGSLSPAPSMSVARTGHAAIFLYDGRLLVTGGRVPGGGITNSAETFDPLSNQWQTLSNPLLNARAGHTVSQLLDGTVLIAGGEDSAGPVSALETFDLYNDFHAAGNLNAARKDHAAATLADGRVLIAGGTGYAADSSLVTLKSTEIYNPDTNAVTAGPSLSVARAKHSATTLLDGRVLIAGGNNGSNDLASAEVYSPATNAIAATDSMSAPRSGHTALLLPNNNAVLIAGGSSNNADVATAELYESWNNAFKATGSMSAARSGAATSATATDGVAVVAGGSNQSSTDLYGYATVKTDKADYVVGETVTISGSGWQPGETVALKLHEVPLADPDKTLYAAADANGNIITQELIIQPQHAGVRFWLTATGTHSVAYNTFTDALQYTVAINPTTANAGVATNYTVTFSNTSLPNDTSNSMACVKITIPGGISPAPSGLSVLAKEPDGTIRTWGVSIVSGAIQAVRTASGGGAQQHDIDAGGTVAVSFVATSTSGLKAWNTNANANTNCTATGQILTLIGADASVNVTAATATLDHFDITAPSTATAGTPFTFSVTPKDSSNAAITGYTGTVHFTSTDSTAVLPPNYTFAGESVHNFTNGATLKTSGIQTLTASDTSSSKTGTSGNITVSAAGASKLVYTTQPGASVAEADITPQPVVAIQDTFGNTVNTATNTVSLAIKSGTGPAGAVLTCSPKAAVAGVATFAGCSIDKAGTGYVLTATSVPVLTPADSTSFNVGAATAKKLAFTTAAVSGSIQQCLGPLTVQSQSTGGVPANVVSATDVTLSSTSGGGTFYSNSTCATALSGSKATIAANSSSASFYYKDANAGTPTVTAAASGLVSATQQQNIGKGTPVITWAAPANITYGAALGAAQLNATADLAGTFVYTPPSGTVLNVGANDLNVEFTPTDTANYNTATKTVSITVLKATPVITWATPADITYGTALSATQLNATANVPGSMVYTPAVGAVLNAGTQALKVDFTPTDAANYNTATKTVSINVSKADTEITWTDPAAITYGTALSAAQLNATASVAGTFAYTPGVGAVLGAGPNTLKVDFTPTDATNYNNSSKTVNIIVAKKPVTADITASDKTYDGTDTATITLCAVNGKVGTDNVSCSATAAHFASANASASPQTVTATVALDGVDKGNYELSSTTATTKAQINKFTPVVTANAAIYFYDGNPHAGTASVAGVGGADISANGSLTFTYTPGDANAPVNAGTYSVVAHFNSSSENYNDADSSPATITIKKADTVTKIEGTFTFVYNGVAHPASVSVTGGGLNLTPDPVYSCGHAPINFADSGCTASYSYAGDDNHNPSSDSKEYTITKADSAVVVTVANTIYDSHPQGGTATVTGVGGLNESLPITYSGRNGTTYGPSATAPTNAGDYTAHAEFDGDANHNGSSDSKNYTIAKADTVTKVTVQGGESFIYDGNPHPATVSVTGGALNLTPEPVYSCTHVPKVVADTNCTASYSYEGDGNHNPSEDLVKYTIAKATSTVTVTVANAVYNGSPQGGTATATGAGGLNESVPVSYSGRNGTTYGPSTTAPANAGDYTASATFAGDANHDGNSDSKEYTIAKAASLTLVSAVGGFTFNYDGNAHPATVSITGAGGLSLAPAPVYSCGHVPKDVADSSCTASYVYAGDANHTGSNDSHAYSIGTVNLTITADNKTKLLNAANPPLTASYNGFVPGEGPANLVGTLSCVTPAGTNSAVGSYAINCSGQTSGNYVIAYVPGTLKIFYASAGACLGDFGHRILQPINWQGDSVFKQKSTVPAKFRVCDANGQSIGTPGVVVSFKPLQVVNGTVVGVIDEAVDSTTPDTAFRWDPTAQQWIFNMNTKSQQANVTYMYRITLNDTSTIDFMFGLK